MKTHALVPFASLALMLTTAATAHAVGESSGGFPNWRERTIHEFMNRARADPATDLPTTGCTSCPDKSCYSPIAPLYYDANLNRAARFHSDEMKAQSYFAHDSACSVVSNISSLYPATCSGAATCACTGGTKSCNPTCTTWSSRVGLFGTATSGEIIASGNDPKGAFYQWLWEPATNATCSYSTDKGHRWNILKAGPLVGTGVTTGGSAVGDFGGNSSGTYKIPSGSHYPQSGSSIEMWANWKDSAGPMQGIVNVEGTCTAMSQKIGLSAGNAAWSVTLSGVTAGCKRYRFEFKDSGGNTVLYPSTGAYYIGTNCAADGSDFSSSPPPTCGCTPMCSGKQCGDDGCGSVCGTCSGSATCEAGQCITPPDPTPDGGTAGGGGGNPDPNAVNATGCSCDVGHTAGTTSPVAPIAALLAVGSALALSLRRRRRES